MSKSKSGQFNWIYAYYQGINDGTFTVNKWIRLVYDYIIKGLAEKKFYFDQKKANHAISWIENHCFHTKGVKAPGCLVLELWEKSFISCIFGIVDEDGRRRFREILLVIGRKNGKSKLASSIGQYILYNDGYGTDVFCIAPKLEQADIIYNDIWQMISLDPEQRKQLELLEERDEHNKRIHSDAMVAKRRKSDIYIAGINSSVKKLAFSSKKSDGFSPSAGLMDEIAAWEGQNGLRQYEVMKSGMGARPEGILLSCTTSGYVNDSIYDELVGRSTRFLLGDSKEQRLLPFLYMIDDPEKWNDITELQKSNPNLGISVGVDFMVEEIAIAEGSLSKKAEFITKYCCLKQNSSLAWLPSKVIEYSCGAPLSMEDFRNTYCVAGIDLSQTRDLTACCAVIERDGELYVFAKFFLPAEKIAEAKERDGVPYDIYIERGFLQLSGDNFIDYHDCFEWFRMLVEEYQIYPLMTGYDRYSAQYLVQDLRTYGMHLDDVFQGDNLYGIIETTRGMLEDRKIHIGDNDLLKMHLYDSAIKMNVERGRGRLVKLSPKVHIDGVAALLDAMCVREKYYSEIGEQLKNED